MGYLIIHKKDKDKMAAMVEDILYTAGDLMRCVEDMREDEYGDRRGYGDRYGMGMRDGGGSGSGGGSMGNRDGYGNRGGYGNRDWDDDEMMGERRRYRRY